MSTALTVLLWAAALAVGLPVLIWLVVAVVAVVIAVKK